ncbi:MAG TPA: diguanylate cyclase [Acetobacteraceae bacterium]
MAWTARGVGLRPRLALLALALMAPMVALQLANMHAQRNEAVAATHMRVAELSKMAAEAENDSLQEAGNLLRVLVRLPELRDPANGDCHALLREITNEHPRVDSVTVTGLDGQARCGSRDAVPSAFFGDRSWFREASAPDAPLFVVSELIVSRFSGKPTVVVAGPIRAGTKLLGVVSIGLNLSWFSEIAARIPGPEGATILLVSLRDGTMLARSADAERWVGHRFPEGPAMTEFRSRPDGTVQGVGLDGAENIIGFTRLPGDIGSRTVVSVGIPLSVVVAAANRHFAEGLALVLLVTMLGLLASWVLARSAVLRPLDMLAELARRLGDGDLAARAQLGSLRVHEFRALGAVLNDAAARIEDRDRQLVQLAEKDGLTGLFNRRHFDKALNCEWRRAGRECQALAVAMIDVDRFKLFNDRYGHPAGDECLRLVAGAVAGVLRRPADLAARYGGEEIVMVMPNTDHAGAMHLAEMLRQKIAALGILHEDAPCGHVTVSIGVAASMPGGGMQPLELVQAADAALYSAKHAGRNRAMLFIDPADGARKGRPHAAAGAEGI